MWEYASIPAPVDGLNLRDSPYTIKPTEATQLDNYLVFDWGIRECGALQTVTNPVGSNPLYQMVYFKTTAQSGKHLVFGNNKVYLASELGFPSATDKTGALTITTNVWRPVFFNKKIFFFNGTNAGLIYDIAADTLAAHSLTGPANPEYLTCGWNYKQRLYAIEKDTTKVWYAGLSAISGAMTSFDVGDYVRLFGTLSFGFTWSLNQGLSNEEVWGVCTTEGEILLYSGDYPGAANWSIITRVRIPPPLGNQSFIQLGQDVLIVTTRGVISLSGIISSRGMNESFYNVSLKLGPNFGGVDVPPVQDLFFPIIYFASESAAYIYALNYERGAWSRISTGLTGTITAMTIYDGALAGSYPPTPPTVGSSSSLIFATSNNAVRINSDSSGNSVSHVWKTGFLPIVPNKQKLAHQIRAFGRCVNGTQSFINSAGVYFDVPTSPAQTDTQTKTSAGTNYVYQDLGAVGAGKRPSVVFSKTSAGEGNELVGFDFFYTLGGEL